MSRKIRVKAIKREQPDIRLYVLALLELARQLQEAEQAAGDSANDARPDDGLEAQHD